MSQENVEAIRAGYDHFNRTGEPDWNLFDPEAEFDASAVPGFGVIKGRAAVIRTLRDYAAAFEDWRIEPEEILDAGESIVAVVRDGGRMKGSGAEVFNRFTHLWTFRGDQVIRWKTFTDKEQALEAAGLPE